MREAGRRHGERAGTKGLCAPSLDPRGRGPPYADEKGTRGSYALRSDEAGAGGAGPGRYGQGFNQTPELVDRIRRRIIGDKSWPVYGGAAGGPLTIANSTVMLRNKIISVLRNVDSGRMRLKTSVYINGRYITVADNLTPCRVEILGDLTHKFMSVSQQIANADYVDVYLITGAVVPKPHHEVTATDWLLVYVREEAGTGGAAELAQSALSTATYTRRRVRGRGCPCDSCIPRCTC